MIEAKLIKRAQRGDRAARDYVLEHAIQFVRSDSYCKRLGRRAPAEFEDLVQDFVFRLIGRVSHWWHNSFKWWLRDWWRQHVIDASRAGSRLTVPVDEWEAGEGQHPRRIQHLRDCERRKIENDLTLKCDRPALQRIAFNSLPQGQRDVLELRYWERLKYHEIAERLKISTSAVGSRLERAHGSKILQERLKVAYDAYIKDE